MVLPGSRPPAGDSLEFHRVLAHRAPGYRARVSTVGRTGVSSTGDTVSGSALSARAMARLVAVCAVLAGLFFMHGLAAQGCAGGVGASAPSMPHPVMMATAADGPDMAAAAMAASMSRPLAHSASKVGADAGEPGAVCVSTPPSPGWAGLLGISVVGLASVPGSPDGATRPSNQRLRAPPLAGSTLLMNLCISRTCQAPADRAHRLSQPPRPVHHARDTACSPERLTDLRCQHQPVHALLRVAPWAPSL